MLPSPSFCLRSFLLLLLILPTTALAAQTMDTVSNSISNDIDPIQPLGRFTHRRTKPISLSDPYTTYAMINSYGHDDSLNLRQVRFSHKRTGAMSIEHSDSDDAASVSTYVPPVHERNDSGINKMLSGITTQYTTKCRSESDDSGDTESTGLTDEGEANTSLCRQSSSHSDTEDAISNITNSPRSSTTTLTPRSEYGNGMSFLQMNKEEMNREEGEQQKNNKDPFYWLTNSPHPKHFGHLARSLEEASVEGVKPSTDRESASTASESGEFDQSLSTGATTLPDDYEEYDQTQSSKSSLCISSISPSRCSSNLTGRCFVLTFLHFRLNPGTLNLSKK